MKVNFNLYPCVLIVPIKTTQSKSVFYPNWQLFRYLRKSCFLLLFCRPTPYSSAFLVSYHGHFPEHLVVCSYPFWIMYPVLYTVAYTGWNGTIISIDLDAVLPWKPKIVLAFFCNCAILLPYLKLVASFKTTSSFSHSHPTQFPHFIFEQLPLSSHTSYPFYVFTLLASKVVPLTTSVISIGAFSLNPAAE